MYVCVTPYWPSAGFPLSISGKIPCLTYRLTPQSKLDSNMSTPSRDSEQMVLESGVFLLRGEMATVCKAVCRSCSEFHSTKCREGMFQVGMTRSRPGDQDSSHESALVWVHARLHGKKL